MPTLTYKISWKQKAESVGAKSADFSVTYVVLVVRRGEGCPTKEGTLNCRGSKHVVSEQEREGSVEQSRKVSAGFDASTETIQLQKILGGIKGHLKIKTAPKAEVSERTVDRKKNVGRGNQFKSQTRNTKREERSHERALALEDSKSAS